MEAGDRVFACSKAGILEVPMIIGRVKNCDLNNDNPLLWDITVAPACDLSKVKDVAVLLLNP